MAMPITDRLAKVFENTACRLLFRKGSNACWCDAPLPRRNSYCCSSVFSASRYVLNPRMTIVAECPNSKAVTGTNHRAANEWAGNTANRSHRLTSSVLTNRPTPMGRP